MKLYYLIWVDMIVRAQSQPGNEKNWKVMTMVFMTVPMIIDFLFLMTIIEVYLVKENFYEINIPYLSDTVAEPIGFVVTYILPPLLINYFLIFWKRRYKRLITKYRSYDGKLAMSYIIIGLFVPVFIVLLSSIIG